uniref:Uncharacterized protein n=1 Tax=Anguilla anguilla TaxID=7936 RepID=A0A0E9RP39_ANGAN
MSHSILPTEVTISNKINCNGLTVNAALFTPTLR